MDPVYAEVGAEVVVGLYYDPNGHFNSTAKKYFGKKTIIIERVSYTCRVEIDKGFHCWPIQDMILASDIPLLTPEQRARIK